MKSYNPKREKNSGKKLIGLGEKKMSKKIIVGTDAFLLAGKNLYERGELTLEQYSTMLRRNKELSKKERNNKVVL